MKRLFTLITILAFSCEGEILDNSLNQGENLLEIIPEGNEPSPAGVDLIVLGEAQDAGAPQLYCDNDCCSELREKGEQKLVSCIGVRDHDLKENYMFDATPDFDVQLQSFCEEGMLNGIFLTHAHIGHYTGLMYLGKESHDAKNIPVYSMPRMLKFLVENGPWSQLVENKNIDLFPLQPEKEIVLNVNLKVVPFLVPHRDEYSETVGYKIIGPEKSALFIPDIDKWDQWEKDIKEEVGKVDYAFLDATFYDGDELGGRDMSQIPHPFVSETMELFSDEPDDEKSKIYFIHINHSNPILNKESEEANHVLANGFNIAYEGTIIEL